MRHETLMEISGPFSWTSQTSAMEKPSVALVMKINVLLQKLGATVDYFDSNFQGVVQNNFPICVACKNVHITACCILVMWRLRLWQKFQEGFACNQKTNL